MADLSTGLYLRMSPADLKRWHAAAAERGLPLAGMIRQSVEWRLSPEGESDARAQVAAVARSRGYAGLAHARKWRPLTESPASWPESGTRMAIVDAADMTRFRIATRVHAPEQMADFIVNGWTHWLPLPPPPKGTHDH